MSIEEKTVNKSSLLNRIRESLSRLNVSELVRAFQRRVTCGNTKGAVKERYLSNEEILDQLNLLQQRFNVQTLILNESSKRRAIKMAEVARESDKQFKRMEVMVAALQKKRKTEQVGGMEMK